VANYWKSDRKSKHHGCGGNRTESKAQHIARSSIKTQRYCDQVDADRGVRRRVNWFTNSVTGGGAQVTNWGKSKFPVNNSNGGLRSARW
jgi:hypothetical protein